MRPLRPKCWTINDARGLVTIELALVLGTFLLLVLGTLEVARVMYVLNTVQDVTRVAARAATVTDFTNAAAMDALRARALLGSASGTLPLVPELGTANVHIEYLGQSANGTVTAITRPQCPAQNVVNCAISPHAGSCIRLVRVSICGATGAGGACTPLNYQPMTGIVPGLASLSIPPSATLVKAESLGYVQGENNCL
ncbi:TadE/TadG family type IV pilus assembly protein [Pseudoduganella albidiflava]|uniref:Pilus assembly protein n=1 Tax=Pseudoduganella albidiflava TaxID=321983 RepID=A0ABX5S1Q4_9BURK|nr:TadE/TadG family type IV pilus assembly protein [Pseudoduganella albidiflava]QBI04161.1 pilus assembly protein [Pseudoduganella albidiflava]